MFLIESLDLIYFFLLVFYRKTLNYLFYPLNYWWFFFIIHHENQFFEILKIFLLFFESKNFITEQFIISFHELNWSIIILHIRIEVFNRKKKDLFTDIEFSLRRRVFILRILLFLEQDMGDLLFLSVRFDRIIITLFH